MAVTSPVKRSPGASSVRRRDPLEVLARVGYSARGVVYFLIAGFAIAAAFGGGGDVRGSQGALSSLTDETWGAVLLSLIAVGLLAFAAWRAIQSVFDADGHGDDGKGVAVRLSLFVSALIHLGLAAFAGFLAYASAAGGRGAGSGGGGGAREQGTAYLLVLPGGQWIVGLIGAIVVIVGLVQFYRAYTARFRKHLRMTGRVARWATPVSRLGIAARGVVFVIVGAFFIQAAVSYSAQQTGGLADALRSIQSGPYGSVLFPIVAVGLLCFAVYCIVEAIYRRIPNPLHDDQVSAAGVR